MRLLRLYGAGWRRPYHPLLLCLFVLVIGGCCALIVVVTRPHTLLGLLLAAYSGAFLVGLFRAIATIIARPLVQERRVLMVMDVLCVESAVVAVAFIRMAIGEVLPITIGLIALGGVFYLLSTLVVAAISLLRRR